MAIYFITGIDTDIGKTYAAAILARDLRLAGHSVITAKLVQTGCVGLADDIVLHRQIMAMDLTPQDQQGLSCPYVFEMPASPHLAAAAQGVTIDVDKIINAIEQLQSQYDIVLVEGAGGWLVPLNEDILIADLVARENWPVIIVSSARLGSINHTLLTMQSVAQARCSIVGIIYNIFQQTEPAITADTKKILTARLKDYNPDGLLLELPTIKDFANIPITNLDKLVIK